MKITLKNIGVGIKVIYILLIIFGVLYALDKYDDPLLIVIMGTILIISSFD